MGMDVYGYEPTTERGTYFRRNDWLWRSLARMMTTLCPEETKDREGWFRNDGYGLNADQANALAEALSRHIESGEVSEYIAKLPDKIPNTPDVRGERYLVFSATKTEYGGCRGVCWLLA